MDWPIAVVSIVAIVGFVTIYTVNRICRDRVLRCLFDVENRVDTATRDIYTLNYRVAEIERAAKKVSNNAS